MKGKSNPCLPGGQIIPAYARMRSSPQKSVIKSKGLSEEEKASVLSCHVQNMSSTAIAKLLNIGRWQVRTIVGKFMAGEPLSRRKGSGRPRKTCPEQDRKILLDIKRNPKMCARDILKENNDLKISEGTVIRRIKESGEFGNYFTLKKPVITEKNRLARVRWAKEHQDWTPEQWGRVLWTDESPFQLRYRKARRVWRRHGDRNAPVNFTPSMKHEAKINVWGCFAKNGVGNLHRIDGIMTKEVYNGILQDQMLPSKMRLFPDNNWIFQQDNDPKHTASINKMFVIDNMIPTFNWPSQSPDLNPIENLWAILDSTCRNRNCKNAAELFETLQTAWNNLPNDILTSLVDSMPRRCAAVIKSKGWPTKY